jgi:2'-5' RNA ligase
MKLFSTVTSLPFLLLLSQSLLASFTHSSTDSCEKVDGDCPDDCLMAGYTGSSNFNALIQISPFYPALMSSARKAESFIKTKGSVQSVDSPVYKLHTTMYYFCCYTPEEEAAIKEGLRGMEWQPFVVTYDAFSCNLDHDNETVYLHAIPSDQSDYVALSRQIEAVIEKTGSHVVERETLFHMTLARVGYDYPVDDVVSDFDDHSDQGDGYRDGYRDDYHNDYHNDDDADGYFGSITVDSFHIDGDVYRASAVDKKD